MLRMRALVALAALSACALVRANEQGNVVAMPQTCKERLDGIYSQYYYPTAVQPVTYNCTDMIQSTLANADGTGCPGDDDIRGCLNYATAAWTNFVADCELFSLPPACDPTGGACNKPVSADPWWLRQVSQLWRPAMYDYGTGIVPNQGPDWLNYAAEGEGKRRYRRLFAEGEGGGGTSGGCFPDFYSAQDFSDWLQGNYQSPEYAASGSINPIGIIFWIVHGIGVVSMAAF